MDIPVLRRKAIEHLCESVGAFTDAARSFDPAAPNPLMAAGVLMHRLGTAIAYCEREEVSKACTLTLIEPAREVFAQSPFVRRLQEWPKGYPGDFETVEYLVAQRNHAPEHSFAWYLEEKTLGCMIAQQHRNKVSHQAQLILQTVFAPRACPGSRPAPAPSRKILLIASGGAPDLRSIAPWVEGTDCQFVLNDLDAGALELAAKAVGSLTDHCTFVQGNIFSSITKLVAHGPFDLVLAGGLFDYPDERAAQFLLKHALSKLCGPGGLFYFSNIAKGNPFRYWIEYLGDWRLLERTESEIQSLLVPFVALIQDIHISRDPTGLTLLTHVRRRPDGHEGPG